MSLPPLYTASESRLVEKMNRYKYLLFQPVAKVLISAGISAGMVSVLSATTVAVSLFLAISFGKVYFIYGIIAHCILDGIDGTLARLTGTESVAGAALDLVADHVGITLSALYAAVFLNISETNAILYVLLYTIVNPVSFMLGVSEHRVSYVFRPRLIVYLLLTIDTFWGTHMTEPVMFMSVIVLFAEACIVLRAFSSKHV